MRTKRVVTRSRGIPETLPDPLVPCADPDCGVEFIPARPWHRYHSPRCRARHWSRRAKSPRTASDPSRSPASSPAESTKPRRLTIHCVVELS